MKGLCSARLVFVVRVQGRRHYLQGSQICLSPLLGADNPALLWEAAGSQPSFAAATDGVIQVGG